MRQNIIAALKKIEIEHQVKILYACESGSRAWGFDSTDSDYDVRFIYCHTKDYYLSVFEDNRDVIELPINDLLDVNGWDLKKVLSLLYKNNLALYEWINSPVTYLDEDVKEELAELVQKCFKQDRAHYHYLSMAKGFYRDHIIDKEKPNIKKLFYCLRSTFACLWIDTYKTMPPVDFNKMLIPELANEAIVSEIKQLMAEKLLKCEKDVTENSTLCVEFVNTSLKYLSDLKPSGKDSDKNVVDNTFRKLLDKFGNFIE